MGWFHIVRDISRAKVPRTTPGPSVQVSCAKRLVPITYGYKNQWGLRLWNTETVGAPGSSLKGPAHRLTDGLAQSSSSGAAV